MATGQEVILTKGTTDSVNSSTFEIKIGKPKLVCIYPDANLGTDEANLMLQDPDGTYVQCTDDNGDIVLSASRTMEVVVGPGIYRLEVATRTASWGAFTQDYYL